jgi:hypothetical protein
VTADGAEDTIMFSELFQGKIGQDAKSLFKIILADKAIFKMWSTFKRYNYFSLIFGDSEVHVVKAGNFPEHSVWCVGGVVFLWNSSLLKEQ